VSATVIEFGSPSPGRFHGDAVVVIGVNLPATGGLVPMHSPGAVREYVATSVRTRMIDVDAKVYVAFEFR
jgi:hypothetical protein